jgi:hypothetical protein
MASSGGRLIDDEPAVVKAAEEPLHLEAMLREIEKEL